MTADEKAERAPVYWIGQLEWFLCRSEAALGGKSTLASVISILERGGPAPSGQLVDPYGESVIGEYFAPEGAVARYREIWPRWRWLSAENQNVLTVHYTHSVAPPSPETDAASSDFGGRRPLPSSVDTAFRVPVPGGRSVSFGAVALYLAKDGKETSRVLKACADLAGRPLEAHTAADRQRRSCLIAPLNRAQKAVAAAHSGYLATQGNEAALWAAM